VLLDFWKNKKVLIIGHTGFVGGWLAQILLLKGANISGIALKPTNKYYLFNLLDLKKKISNYFCDINNFSKLNKIISKINPEIIFHFASQSLVSTGYEKSIQTFDTNVRGTINILESCRLQKKIKSLLVMTSDKCYQNNEKKYFFTEEYPLGGDDPYSASKACQEIIVNSYKKSFFNKKIGISTVRAGNIIGGADWAENRLIVDIVKSYHKNKTLFLRNPNAIRPWQHVFDVLNGCMLLAKKMYISPNNFSSAWNFGPSKNKINEFATVEKILNKINNYFPKKIKIQIIKSQYREKKNLFLNSNKSKKFLGWQKVLDLNSSLKLTLDWYLYFIKNKEKNAISNYTNKQINSFFKII
jgi:CDP-glucose 4,6-dehydratase